LRGGVADRDEMAVITLTLQFRLVELELVGANEIVATVAMDTKMAVH
jgi:hypothetical protein